MRVYQMFLNWQRIQKSANPGDTTPYLPYFLTLMFDPAANIDNACISLTRTNNRTDLNPANDWNTSKAALLALKQEPNALRPDVTEIGDEFIILSERAKLALEPVLPSNFTILEIDSTLPPYAQTWIGIYEKHHPEMISDPDPHHRWYFAYQTTEVPVWDMERTYVQRLFKTPNDFGWGFLSVPIYAFYEDRLRNQAIFKLPRPPGKVMSGDVGADNFYITDAFMDVLIKHNLHHHLAFNLIWDSELPLFVDPLYSAGDDTARAEVLAEYHAYQARKQEQADTPALEQPRVEPPKPEYTPSQMVGAQLQAGMRLLNTDVSRRINLLSAETAIVSAIAQWLDERERKPTKKETHGLAALWGEQLVRTGVFTWRKRDGLNSMGFVLHNDGEDLDPIELVEEVLNGKVQPSNMSALFNTLSLNVYSSTESN